MVISTSLAFRDCHQYVCTHESVAGFDPDFIQEVYITTSLRVENESVKVHARKVLRVWIGTSGLRCYHHASTNVFTSGHVRLALVDSR